MAKTKVNKTIVVVAAMLIIALGAFAWVSTNGTFKFQVASPVGPADSDSPQVAGFCDLSVVAPDIDIDAVNEDSKAAVTDAKNLYHNVKEVDGGWTTFTLGTEVTNLEFGETYEFFIPGDLTTSNTKAVAFGPYIKWTAPCKEDTSYPEITVCNDETYDGLSATFYNEDHNAAAQTFSTGDKKTIELVWKAGADECFGHPYLSTYPMLGDNGYHSKDKPNVLCLKLNSTVWEVPEKVYLDGGEELDRVGVPVIASADSAATHVMYCYEAPVMRDSRTSIFVDMEADSSEAPDVDDTAYLYGGNIYFHSTDKSPAWGVEDDTGAYAAGNGDADELTLDFT